jgi:hypothetical protein
MELINSFFSNLKNKLSNPFFGTLIAILLIHHWPLWFGVFNFDDYTNLNDKLLFVKDYVVKNITWESFIIDTLRAMIFMLLGYLIIVFTRSIVLWVEFWLMPFITGKIVNKNVVIKSEYDNVVIERDEYFDQYEKQRKNNREFSKTIDEQNDQIRNKDSVLLDQSQKISDASSTISENNELIEKQRKEINSYSQQVDNLEKSNKNFKNDNLFNLDMIQKYSELFFEEKNRKYYTSEDKFPTSVLDKVNEVKKANMWEAFLRVGYFFDHGGSIPSELVTEMVKLGLAFNRGSREDFTPMGKIIYRYRAVFEE